VGSWLRSVPQIIRIGKTKRYDFQMLHATLRQITHLSPALAVMKLQIGSVTLDALNWQVRSMLRLLRNATHTTFTALILERRMQCGRDISDCNRGGDPLLHSHHRLQYQSLLCHFHIRGCVCLLAAESRDMWPTGLVQAAHPAADGCRRNFIHLL
jgi:hypothetical protein